MHARNNFVTLEMHRGRHKHRHKQIHRVVQIPFFQQNPRHRSLEVLTNVLIFLKERAASEFVASASRYSSLRPEAVRRSEPTVMLFFTS